MNLTPVIGGLAFQNPILNAAGHCKNDIQFEALLRSSASGINVGSIMPDFRTGNRGEVYWTTPAFTLNSLGIPCQAPEFYEEYLPGWVREAEKAEKHLVLNIAGFKIGDYVALAKLAAKCGVRIIEVNFGCPNLVDTGEQKPIFSFDIELMEAILRGISLEINSNITQVWVKFSPFSNFLQIPAVAAMIVPFEMISAVVTTNTFPNGFGFKDNGKPMIDPNEGLAGVSGPPMFPIGLGQVKQWRKALDKLESSIAVVGVGGIDSGSAVMDYFRAGAVLAEVGTAYFNQGEKIFERLLGELVVELEKQTVTT